MICVMNKRETDSEVQLVMIFKLNKRFRHKNYKIENKNSEWIEKLKVRILN